MNIIATRYWGCVRGFGILVVSSCSLQSNIAEQTCQEGNPLRTLFKRTILNLFTPLVLAVFSALMVSADGAKWGYEFDNGPDHWGKIAPICAEGGEQSPIDLDLGDSIPAMVKPIEINWVPFTPGLLNNGHTIELVASGNAGSVSIGGTEFELLQIHFHHLSEHTFAGEHRAMEAHLVHRSTQGDIVVLSATFEEGAENPVLGAIGPVLETLGKMVQGTAEIDPNDLLPQDQSAYRYKGSLTTPGCFEVVTWHVMQNPVTASAAQIASFAKQYPNNYRPVQDLGRRYVLHSQ